LVSRQRVFELVARLLAGTLVGVVVVVVLYLMPG